MSDGKNNDLLQLLEIVTEQRGRVHESIWEIEKHFTWWIYAILGFIVLIYSSTIPKDAIGFVDPIQKFVLIFILSLFGLCISYFGFGSVRREGEHHKEIMEVSNRILWKLQSTLKIDDIPVDEEIEQIIPKDWYPKKFSVMKEGANKTKKELILGKSLRSYREQNSQRNVRDYFQLLFILAGITFFLICILSIYQGIVESSQPQLLAVANTSISAASMEG